MATEQRTYETICLTKVDMPEDKYKALVDKCKDAITAEKGNVVMLDNWGKAKIAYPINKEPRAQWTYFRYQADSKAVDAIKHQLRINEFVLRQITVRTTEDGSDYNTLRANIGREIGEKFRENREDRPHRGRRPYGRDGGGHGGGRGGDRYRERDNAGHMSGGADRSGDVHAPSHAPSAAPASTEGSDKDSE
jgi:small subunit ribosomal protein S6